MFALAIVWAIYLRFWGTWNRSLWMDEAAVANMVLDTSWTGLFTQTDIPVAPLFAVLVKFTGSLIAPPEVGYRLIPIIAGILCIPLVYLVMRSMRIPPAPSLFAMAICASSPWLVIWSRELKQYEVEALTSLILALCVMKLLYGPSDTRRLVWAIVAAITCLIAPWLGYGFLFAAFALFLALVIIRPKAGSRPFAVITAVVSVLVMLLSTALLLHLLARGQADHEALRSFMSPWFIDLTSPHSIARAAGYMLSDGSIMVVPYYRWIWPFTNSAIVGALVWLLILFGLWTWPRRTRMLMVIWIFGIWGGVALAAIARQYPFGAVRMLVFMAPPMTCAMAMGILGFLRYLPTSGISPSVFTRATLIASFLPVLYLVWLPIGNDYWVNQDFKAALGALGERRAPNEHVFVSLDAVQSVRFYARGKDAGFDYVPVTNGTRPVPNYDYQDLARRVIADYDDRCWMLTIGRTSEQSWQSFITEARKRGYTSTLVCEEGGVNGAGRAQLFMLERR